MSHKLDSSPLMTSVVGSYPANIGTSNIMNQFYFKKDPGIDAIRYAVGQQEKAGINIISDGQVRKDMISIVTSCCHGINTGPKPTIIGEIKRKCPIITKDIEFIDTLKGKDTHTKGILTGPYTLSKNCLDNHYNSNEKVAWAFTDVLKQELSDLKDTVDIIQLDEPFLSVEYFEPMSDMIRELKRCTKLPVALHVCGDIRPIFPHLIDFNTDIMDHEFVAHPCNQSILKEYSIKKKIGFGCVSVEDRTLESVIEIKDRIKKALDILPPDQLIIDPDCGLRNLTDDLAFAKLKNMVKARDELIDELQLT